MKKLFSKVLLICLLVVMSAGFTNAQTRDKLVGITYRTSDLQLCNGDLGDFYKNYVNQSYNTDIFFENLHIIKNKKSFYLIAKEQNSNRMYVFSLARKGNGLYLNTEEQVLVSTKSEAIITAYLQNEGATMKCIDCIEPIMASIKP